MVVRFVDSNTDFSTIQITYFSPPYKSSLIIMDLWTDVGMNSIFYVAAKNLSIRLKCGSLFN